MIKNYANKDIAPLNIQRDRDDLLSEFGKSTLRDRYLYQDESYQDMFARVAMYYADDDAHAQRLYDRISCLHFMPATPILANGGTERGLPISCFLNEAQDSLESIAELWHENIFLAAKGGGIGSYFSNIRSINEPITLKGYSSGVIPFIKVTDSMTLGISQGSLRRGSAAVYLKIDHPEIEEFIDLRRPTGGDYNRKCLNIHHGVVITDAFMHAVAKNEEWHLISPLTKEAVSTINARELWIKLITTRLETGEPYILFIDNVNKYLPVHHQLINEKYNTESLKVKTSNLCVAPETKILTKQGWVEIQTLKDQGVEIWNGFEWSEVEVKKTGTNQKLIKVKTSDGNELYCTEYHKWHLQLGYKNYKTNKVIKTTNELNVGDKIIKYNFPIIEGYKELHFAYQNGFYSGDGCYLQKTKKHRIYLYNDKQKLKDIIGFDGWCIRDKYNRIYIDLPDEILRKKFFVPDSQYTIESRLKWFAGLCDADGTIARNIENESLQIASINLHFLHNVQKMLNTLSVLCKIQLVRIAGNYLLPKNNGTKELCLYPCRDVYRLLIDSNELYKLSILGLKFYRLEYIERFPQRKAAQFINIVGIEDTSRIDDTYCFNDAKRHTGVFNGILSSQCSEITLPTGLDHLNKERTAVCCLSSLNLEYYHDWVKDECFIEDVMRFLDNVLTDFINKAPDSMARAKYSAMRERSVGLGVMGFHSLLQKTLISVESSDVKQLNLEIFKYLKDKVDKASVVLAKERGPCPDAEEVGVMERFTNKLAIAPTASISNICGETSPGIEPYAANAFTQKTLSGSFIVRNEHLRKVLQKYDKDIEEIWSSIATNNGSVQHLDFLSGLEREVFKTALEINQKYLIELAADRTPFICQGQSLNLFFYADISKKELHEVHYNAWKLGNKSLYYCRSRSLQRAEKVSK